MNTIFGFAAYSALVLLGLPPSIALLMATVVGIFFNFATFGGYAFRRLHARRFPGFLLAYGCIYLFNLALLTGLRAVSGLGPISAQLACLIVVAPTAYLVLRMKVFHDRVE